MSNEQPRVMAIDDDPLILRYMEVALTRAGYNAVLVQDPASVRDKLRSDPPDLVLLDIQLPGTSGFEIFSKVREETTAPVIFVSASTRTTDRQRAMAIGATKYIEKPFRPAALLQAIECALQETDGAQPGAA